MTFGLCACGFLPNNIVAITCPQCGVPQCADCESSPVPPLSWAKGRAGGGPPVIIFPTDLKRRYYWFRPHSLGLHPPRCPWEASPPRESVSPVASLLSISPTINSQQPLLSLTGNIRNCHSLPTDSRDPLSDSMIGPSTPLCLRGDFGGPPSFARPLTWEASSLCSYELATIPTFSTRECLELPPTSNGSSRYTVRGQL
jgi:hypothetical protein